MSLPIMTKPLSVWMMIAIAASAAGMTFVFARLAFIKKISHYTFFACSSFVFNGVLWALLSFVLWLFKGNTLGIDECLIWFVFLSLAYTCIGFIPNALVIVITLCSRKKKTEQTN